MTSGQIVGKLDIHKVLNVPLQRDKFLVKRCLGSFREPESGIKLDANQVSKRVLVDVHIVAWVSAGSAYGEPRDSPERLCRMTVGMILRVARTLIGRV